MQRFKKIISVINIFKNISLKAKLWSLVLMMFIIICSAEIVGFVSTRSVTQDVFNMYKSTASVNYLVEINQSRLELIQYLWTVYAEYHVDGKVAASALKDVTDTTNTIQGKMKDYGIQIANDPKETEVLSKIDKVWTPLKKGTALFIEKANEAKIPRAEMQKKVSELSDLGLTVSDAVSEGMGIIKQRGLDSYTNTQKIEKISTLLYFGLAGFSLLITFICLIIVARVSKGLLVMTQSLSDSSYQVSSASQQLSGASEQLSTDAQSQASALEEASASLTEISGMAESNTKNASAVEKHANAVLEFSQNLQKSMIDLSTAMEAIMDSNKKMSSLTELIEDISNKTQIIDDIVFKTQLLSFNASVEAERAGEHGRGFSVVAQEVGNLAQVSGKAATEISAIVKTSIKETENVSRDNKGRVENGSELVAETKKSLESVTNAVGEIIEMISKITEASREQSVGIKQVADSMESLNQTTQKTAHTAQDSAGASTELSGQAGELLKVVSNLETVVYGKAKS